MSDPNGTSTEDWGDVADNVLDCTARFVERMEIAEKLRAQKEKQKKILEDYKIKHKDPKAPPPNSEVLVTKEHLLAVMDGVDQNMKMLATGMDEQARAYNQMLKSCRTFEEKVNILVRENEAKTRTIELHVKILRRIMNSIECMCDDLQDHYIPLKRTEKFFQRCAEEDRNNEQTPTT